MNGSNSRNLAAFADNVRRFVYEAVDAETDCVCLSESIEVVDVSELENVCGLSPGSLETRAVFDINDEAFEKSRHYYGLKLDRGSMSVRIRPWARVDRLPYQVHANRELLLMLSGKKPLSVFMGCVKNSNEWDVPELKFSPHVAAGRIIKEEHLLKSWGHRKMPSRLVLYSLPQETWRIHAYILMMETATASGWNIGFERMQGSLLGYEDWQNDAYIKEFFGSE